MVVEAGVVAGYMIAWAVRRARRVAERAGAEADEAIDAGLERLHEVVAAKLGAHPALTDLAEEAAAGEDRVSELTRRQVESAVTAAARKDDAFGRAVGAAVARLRAAEEARGVFVIAGSGSAVFTGDVDVRADAGAIAVGQVGGDVRVGREVSAGPPPDPSGPGRSSA
jgi:hypothetical protein